MKRFEFKLQGLLNYKSYLEKLARQETAKARMAVTDCEERIIGLRKKLTRSMDHLNQMVVQGTSATLFKQYTTYVSAMEIDIETEQETKISLEQIFNEKCEILNEKLKDKKAMERLRDRRKTEYFQEALKMEQKDLDEISSLKSARRIIHDGN